MKWPCLNKDSELLLSPNQRDLIRQALKSPPPLDECLSGLSEEAGRLALRDSVLMAAADGEVDDDEKEVLKKLLLIWD